MEHIDVILNVFIALLLLITIIFCLILSKRISVFNSNKKELGKFLLDFNDSIIRAEKNINLLKEMGSQVDENLKAQIKRARFLANDLSFLSEKGEVVAQNLEGKIHLSRDVQKKIVSDNLINNNFRKELPVKDSIVNSESFKPKASVNTNSEKTMISPSKRKALDAILQEIAKRKSEVK
jgi:hypothetical protein